MLTSSTILYMRTDQNYKQFLECTRFSFDTFQFLLKPVLKGLDAAIPSSAKPRSDKNFWFVSGSAKKGRADRYSSRDEIVSKSYLLVCFHNLRLFSNLENKVSLIFGPVLSTFFIKKNINLQAFMKRRKEK